MHERMNAMNIKYDEKGLVPAVAQDYISGKVLMVAYMNAESLRLTQETGKATYFSRSRQKLWVKGEHSGNFQIVKEILPVLKYKAILEELQVSI